jgi:hypothetical protein
MASMLDALQSLYSEAADEITAALPSDWTNVYVHVELDDQTQAVAAFYRGRKTTAPTFVDLPDPVFVTFAKMRAVAMSNDPKGAWTTASFVLDNNGHFTIDYGYEPIPVESESARRRAWRDKLGLH